MFLKSVGEITVWFGNGTPQFSAPPRLSQTTHFSRSLHLSLPLLAVAATGSTRGKYHGLRQEQFAGNSNAIRKQPQC